MMQTDDMEGALRKVRGLLRLGNDAGATEAEAANALRYARRLLLKLNMTEEEVAGTESPARDPHEVAAETEYGQEFAAGSSGKAVPWEGSLAMAMCMLVGTVKCYRSRGEVRRPDGTLVFDEYGNPERRAGMVFYGPVEDVVAARTMFHEWREAIVALARMKFGGAIRGDGRDYAGGFVHALYERAKDMARVEIRELEESPSSRMALVATRNAQALMAAKSQRADRWLRETTGVRLSNRRVTVGYNGDAYRAGRADGQRANIGARNARRIGG